DEHVIGRRQGGEAMTCRVEHPERAALICDEDPPRRIDRRPNGTPHPARYLCRGLAIGADTPNDAVWTVGDDYVAAGDVRADTVEAVAAGLVRKRMPLCDGVALRVDRDHTVASLLAD